MFKQRALPKAKWLVINQHLKKRKRLGVSATFILPTQLLITLIIIPTLITVAFTLKFFTVGNVIKLIYYNCAHCNLATLNAHECYCELYRLLSS